MYRLLETMLSPLDRKLALAPIDNEPVTPEEAAAIEAGIASLEGNGGVPLEEVLADFGLTLDDFHRMAERPLFRNRRSVNLFFPPTKHSFFTMKSIKYQNRRRIKLWK